MKYSQAILNLLQVLQANQKVHFVQYPDLAGEGPDVVQKDLIDRLIIVQVDAPQVLDTRSRFGRDGRERLALGIDRQACVEYSGWMTHQQRGGKRRQPTQMPTKHGADVTKYAVGLMLCIPGEILDKSENLLGVDLKR